MALDLGTLAWACRAVFQVEWPVRPSLPRGGSSRQDKQKPGKKNIKQNDDRHTVVGVYK